VTLVGGVCPTTSEFARYLHRAHEVYPKDLWQTQIVTWAACQGSTPSINRPSTRCTGGAPSSARSMARQRACSASSEPRSEPGCPTTTCSSWRSDPILPFTLFPMHWPRPLVHPSTLRLGQVDGLQPGPIVDCRSRSVSAEPILFAPALRRAGRVEPVSPLLCTHRQNWMCATYHALQGNPLRASNWNLHLPLSVFYIYWIISEELLSLGEGGH
jgi:hypothetical protein